MQIKKCSKDTGMILLYSQEDRPPRISPYEKCVFLAGPTPRSNDVASWRPEAIRLFEESDYDGYLCVPEFRNGKFNGDYMGQVEWEHRYLDQSNAILMWVPREMNDMPAFTTNIEFGLYVSPSDEESRLGVASRLFYGRPDGAPKTTYMDYCYKKFTERKPQSSLKKLVDEVIKDI